MTEMPLHLACVAGAADEVRQLIRSGHSLEARDEKGFTALQYALGIKHAACAIELVEAGARWVGLEVLEGTSLARAAYMGDSTLVGAMIASDREAACGHEGWRALLMACWWGWEAIAEALIDIGVDVNQADKDGKSPLLHAAGGFRKRPNETILRLLKAWAFADARDDKGDNALHLSAKRRGSHHYMTHLVGGCRELDTAHARRLSGSD